MAEKNIPSNEFSEHQMRQMREVFNERTNALVLPTLNEILENQEDHTLRLSRIENRQNVEQETPDRHDRRIVKLEKRPGPVA